MKKLMNYVFLENSDNKVVFGILGVFIIIGLIIAHIDTNQYVSGWQENKIWIYTCSGIWLFWFAINVIKYYVDKPKG